MENTELQVFIRFKQARIRTITGDCEADNWHEMQCSSRKIDRTVNMTTAEGIRYCLSNTIGTDGNQPGGVGKVGHPVNAPRM